MFNKIDNDYVDLNPGPLVLEATPLPAETTTTFS